MVEWTCPSCGGGFPEPIIQAARWKCPWCAKPIAKWAQGHGKRQVEKIIESPNRGKEESPQGDG